MGKQVSFGTWEEKPHKLLGDLFGKKHFGAKLSHNQ